MENWSVNTKRAQKNTFNGSKCITNKTQLLVFLQLKTKSIKYRIKIYLSPGNKGVKVKSSANIAPTAHMSANNLRKQA